MRRRHIVSSAWRSSQRFTYIHVCYKKYTGGFLELWHHICWVQLYFELQISNVLLNFCVAHLPRRWYIQCCTEDGDSPAVTWAWTWIWTWTWCSCGSTSDESDVIWIVIGCQTVVLRIEGSIVCPPHVRPLFLVIWVFYFQFWGVGI